MRVPAIATALLWVLAAAEPVAADPSDRAPALQRRGGLRDATGRNPVGSRERSRASLERFAAEKQARARIDAATRGDVVPRAAALNALPDDATPAQRRAFAERLRRQDEAAFAGLRADLDALERRAGRPLGPATRRVLEANILRGQGEREDASQGLRRAIEAEPPPAPERHFLGD